MSARTETHIHTHTKEGLHQQRSMRIHAGGFIWSWTTALSLIPETHTDRQTLNTHLPKLPNPSYVPAVCVVVCGCG